jgi:glycosyltransferase 2 family protein
VNNDILPLRPAQTFKHRCRRHARLAVTVALLTWVAVFTKWQEVGEAFGRLRLEWWLAAVGMLLTTQLLSAWRWQTLARPFGFERTVSQLTGYYFIGMYFNLLLPTAVGGDVIRAWYLDGGSGRRLAALAAVFLDRLSGLMVLLGLACLGLTLSPLKLPAWVPWFVWGTAAAAAAAIAGAPLLARTGERLARPLQKLRLALDALRTPKLLLGSTLLSVGVQTGNVILVWLVGRSIGAEVPIGYYFIMVPMVSLLTMLPVSIGGWGVRENATALMLAPLGVSDGPAKTLAILWGTVFVAVSLLGGTIYLFGRFPKLAAGTAMADTEVENGSFGSGADQGRAGQHQAAA